MTSSNPSPTILFIVNGLGLGNSTRCDSIIQAIIQRGFHVDVVTSGNGVGYFGNRDYISKVYQFQALYYGSSGSELSIWRTLLALPDFLRIYLNNVKYLRTILRTGHYKAVVIDSDYTLFWLKRSVQAPILALNNADLVIEECQKLPAVPSSIRMQYMVEKCDDWFHRKVPDLVLSPSILPKTDGRPKIMHLPPFVRPGLTVRKPDSTLKSMLVMLSGSQFGSTTEFLNRLPEMPNVKIEVVGREGQSTSRITFHGKLFHNRDLVNNADMMVVNGGFSAISEAIVLRKPVVVIPVPHHAEQFINAKIIESAGLGLVATHENVDQKIQEMVARFDQFVQAHEGFACATNGANEAARMIEQMAGSPN